LGILVDETQQVLVLHFLDPIQCPEKAMILPRIQTNPQRI